MKKRVRQSPLAGDVAVVKNVPLALVYNECETNKAFNMSFITLVWKRT